MMPRLFFLLTGAAIIAAPLSVTLAQDAPKVAPKVAPKAAPAAAADTAPPKGLPVDAIAAVVGDQVVLVSEVLAAVNAARSGGAKINSPQELVKLEQDILQQLVEAELLVQKAKELKVEPNETDVQRSIDDNEKQIRSQFKTETEFKSALKDAGFGTLDEWRKLQHDQLRRRNLQQEVVGKLKRDGKMTAINVTEAEINEAFESNRAKLPRKEARVGLRQIVIATKPSEESKKKARVKIDSLRAELDKHPEDFENMAKKESMDGSKELGGDLGWNRRGRMVPEFDRMMFALNPGVISPVIETAFGYHIIRVDRVQPAEVKARHILIRPSLDTADERRAKALADSIATAWRAGGSFDSLSVKFHDAAGGEDKAIPEYPRSELPEQYRNALEGKKVGDIIDPFPTPDPSAGVNKFIVAQVTFLDTAGEFTLKEVRERLRTQLSEERSMRRLIDSLKKQTYVSVRYDPAKQVVTP